jgi:hypothetical protein
MQIDWSHSRGRGVVNHNGLQREADIHWFEHRDIGVTGMKIKDWLD